MGCSVLVGWFAVSAALMSVLSACPLGTASSDAPRAGPSILSNVVMIVQGENDITPGREAPNEFYFLKILVVELPCNATRIHTNVPHDARELNVWSTLGQVANGSYGWEGDGPYSGSFFVDVPANQSCTGYLTNITDTEAEFAAPGSSMIGLNYSSGALRLDGTSTMGTFISAPISVPGAYTVLSANLTILGSGLAGVTMELSNNNGTTWYVAANATMLEFPTNGTQPRVRLTFDANASGGGSPEVRSLQLSLVYAKLTSVFTVHISFLASLDFVARHASIDLTEPMPYADTGMFLLMLYVLEGYLPESDSLGLELDTSSAALSYPGKKLYTNTSYSFSPIGFVTVRLTAPPGSYAWVVYLIAGAGVFFGAAALFFFARKREQDGRPRKERATEGPEGPAEAQVEARRKELVARKKELLAEIEQFKVSVASGELGREEAKTRLAALRQEFKAVRNELNRLSRKRVPAREISTQANEETTDEYESVLAVLARLDADYEKGRLPEAAYRSMRKSYLTRAARLKAAREERGSADKSSIEQEKAKLMEAILALDDEHERGGMDERVYQELRASYKRELAALMRRLEESEGGGLHR